MKSVRSLIFSTIILFLTQSTVAMEIPNISGNSTAFMLACKRHDWQTVNSFLHTNLKTTHNSVNQCDENGDTPLHLAVIYAVAIACHEKEFNDATDIINKLIDAGATIDAVNYYGLTPLMLSILGRDSQTTCLLMKRGANKDLQPAGKYINKLSAAQLLFTLIDQKAIKAIESEKIIKELVGSSAKKYDQDFSPMSMQPIASALTATGEALAPIPSCDIKDYKISAANPFKMQRIAQLPATASMVSNSEELPLEQGALYGPYCEGSKIYTRSELMEALNKKILEPNDMYNVNEIAPIITATMDEDKEVIECLMQNGLKYIDELDDKNETALHKAARTNNASLIQYLINIGLSLDEQNNRGNTPIMIAIQHGNINTFRTLFEYSSEIDTITNHKKESTLIVAIKTGNPSVVELLLTEKNFSFDSINNALKFARNKLKSLSMEKLIKNEGTNLASITDQLHKRVEKMNEEAFAQLETDEKAIVIKKTNQQIAFQAVKEEAALLPTRAKLFPILAMRCGLALDKNATAASVKKMNPGDSALKILCIIAKQLGLEEKQSRLTLARNPISHTKQSLKTHIKHTKKQSKALKANTK